MSHWSRAIVGSTLLGSGVLIQVVLVLVGGLMQQPRAVDAPGELRLDLKRRMEEIAIPAGAVRVSVDPLGMDGLQSVFRTSKDMGEVSQHFLKVLPELGWSFQRREADAKGSQSIFCRAGYRLALELIDPRFQAEWRWSFALAMHRTSEGC